LLLSICLIYIMTPFFLRGAKVRLFLFATMHLARFRAVGRCAIFGFVLLGQKKSLRCISHISPDSVRLVDVRYSVLYCLARKNHKDAYRTSRPIPFGWSMSAVGNSPLFLTNRPFHDFPKPAFSRFSQTCEPLILVKIFGKIVKRQVCQKRGWVADGWSMCDIRFCISWPEKITRCTSHISSDSVSVKGCLTSSC